MNHIGSPSSMAEEYDAHDLARYGFLMHLVGGVLWLILGAWQISEYSRFSDYVIHPDKAPAGLTNPAEAVFLATLLAAIFIIFAIIAFIMALVIRVVVLDPLARQEFEMAARYMTVLGGLGIVFGFGIGGVLMMLSFQKMRQAMRARTAPPAATVVAEATPVCQTCGTPARFIHGEQRWHCDHCARFL
jgi:hypothetical protein